MKVNKRVQILLLLGVALLVYVIFPSNNSSNDSYGSAADIKNHLTLLMPHHLLHGVFLYVLIEPVVIFFPKVDVLALSKIYSALFSVLNLGLLYLLLVKINPEKKNKLLYVALVAFSFGAWRFSTDNEFYILPIFFSLLGSFYYLKYKIESKPYLIVFSGFFVAFACLIHQIHFFWWLGMLIGMVFDIRKIKMIIFFTLPALVVPFSYSVAVSVLQGQLSFTNVEHYIFDSYYSGTAPVEFGLKNFFFFFVGLFRAFLQVFPYFLILFKRSYIYFIPVLFFVFILIYIVKLAFKRQLLKPVFIQSSLRSFGRTHILILGLELLFALFSMGNGEFMIMAPFLIAILLFTFYEVNRKVLSAILCLFAFWNFVLGIYPLNQFQFSDAKQLVKVINQNKNSIFIVKQADICNIYAYEYGNEEPERILPFELIDLTQIDSLLKMGVPVFTDVIAAPTIINRGSYDLNSKSEALFQSFRKTKIDSIATFYGNFYIYQISLND